MCILKYDVELASIVDTNDFMSSIHYYNSLSIYHYQINVERNVINNSINSMTEFKNPCDYFVVKTGIILSVQGQYVCIIISL